MKINISGLGKFHIFDLARQLNQKGYLNYLYSAYPKFKFKHEAIPLQKIKTFPYFHSALMALPVSKFINKNLTANIQNASSTFFAKWLCFKISSCNVYVGLSGSSLRAGKKIQKLGGAYVCDRGSSHTLHQAELLKIEALKLGMDHVTQSSQYIGMELQEYEQADIITVPSTFAYNSFVKYGISPDKLKLIPYGVDLNQFHPTTTPDDKYFDVLFVGHVCMRKGVHYLLAAFKQLSHANKRLTLIGSYSVDYIEFLKKHNLWSDDINLLGPIKSTNLKEYYSQSHVLVLPSIEDGFGLVITEAMACGCPVIATTHTGAVDVYQSGREGYIVPAYEVEPIVQSLQNLANDPKLRMEMGRNSQKLVKKNRGWESYGEQVVSTYKALLN